MEKIEEYIQQFTAKDYLIKLGIQGFEKLVQILITLVALLIVKFIALKLLDFYYTRYEKYAHKKPNATLRSLLENAIRYVYYFFLIYSVLSILGVPVATLVAGAGVLSLAVGFGAQGFVSDIVNGAFPSSLRELTRLETSFMWATTVAMSFTSAYGRPF